MILLKIGDAIINEHMFIGIETNLIERETEIEYSFEAHWQYGDRVVSRVVRTVMVPIGNARYTKDEIANNLAIAYGSLFFNPTTYLRKTT